MEFQHPRWIARGRVLVEDRPIIMGIVNITPDSFSDGGRSFSHDDAFRNALELIAAGADILDLGGESSRPGADSVPLEEELRRVIPVVKRLRERSDIPVSIDTTKPEVARQALAEGADLVNDITALGDPEMARVVSQFQAGVVLMHMAGTPQTMQLDPQYRDVTSEVLSYLAARADYAVSLGIARDSIAIDPGIGFGKTLTHNLELLRNTEHFTRLGLPVLMGISRKGLLGTLTGRARSERVTASVVSSLLTVERGASIVRVHDVGPMRDALRIWQAFQSDPTQDDIY